MPAELSRDPVAFEWRGDFDGDALNRLHAEAFDHRVYSVEEWDWRALVERHSLGWVVAHGGGELLGFANVPWDGFVHAWLQDVMVARRAQRRGIGVGLVSVATEAAREAGCEWLHVDYDDDLDSFYRACGFTPARAGLIEL